MTIYHLAFDYFKTFPLSESVQINATAQTRQIHIDLFLKNV